jgi:hypothetical protein
MTTKQHALITEDANVKATLKVARYQPRQYTTPDL